MLRLLLIACILGVWQQSAAAQPTQPADDAAKLYLQAAKLIRDNDTRNIMSPASSNATFPPFPPYPAEWVDMEKASFLANALARDLVHQARAIDHSNWPARHSEPKGVSYLNDCRNIANELADAAEYEQINGDNAAAIETLRDEWHLSDLLENQPDKTLIRLLVAVGIRAALQSSGDHQLRRGLDQRCRRYQRPANRRRARLDR